MYKQSSKKKSLKDTHRQYVQRYQAHSSTITLCLKMFNIERHIVNWVVKYTVTSCMIYTITLVSR